MASGHVPSDPRALDDELGMVQMLLGRGDVSGARALCRRVLDENPQSGAVMAAMGDIAAGDGAWAEAVSWYERAVEAEFSPALMQRLADARAHVTHPALAEAPGQPLPPQVAGPRPTIAGPTVGGGTQTRQRARDRQTLAIVIAAFLVVTLVAALLVRSATTRPHRATVPTPTRLGGGLPNGAAPTAGAPPAAAPGGGYSVPSVSAGAGQPTSPVRHTGSQPAPAPPSAPPAVIVSSREHQLLNRMRMEKWSEGTRVPGSASMASDPYAGQAIITLQAPRTADVWTFEADILTAAYRVAASALRNDADLQSVVVRCIGRATSAEGQDEDLTVFRASVTRARITDWINRAEMPTFEQMNQQVFDGVWWDKEAEERVLEREAQRASEGRTDTP